MGPDPVSFTRPTSMPKAKRTTTGKARAKRGKSWRDVVLEVMAETRGQTVRLPDLYARIEAHPEAKRRASTNRNVRAKVRQVLQRLRDDGVIEWLGPGEWRLPAATAEPSSESSG